MPAVPIILAATAVVSTGVSIYEGSQAAKASKQAVQLQQQQNDIVAARQQRDAIRQARIANAAAAAAGERQNVGFGSAESGGTGSIVSQLNSNLSFLDAYNAFSDQASSAIGRAKSYESSANTFGEIAGAAEKALPYSNQISAGAKKIFGGGG